MREEPQLADAWAHAAASLTPGQQTQGAAGGVNHSLLSCQAARHALALSRVAASTASACCGASGRAPAGRASGAAGPAAACPPAGSGRFSPEPQRIPYPRCKESQHDGLCQAYTLACHRSPYGQGQPTK